MCQEAFCRFRRTRRKTKEIDEISEEIENNISEQFDENDRMKIIKFFEKLSFQSIKGGFICETKRKNPIEKNVLDAKRNEK